jgi:hypothetical protein
VIKIRLRIPIRYYSRDQLDLWPGPGLPPPTLTIPARTTLDLVDFPYSDFSALCHTPDGKIVKVTREVLRKHAYIPRCKPSST